MQEKINISIDIDAFQKELINTIAHHRKLYIAQGTLFILFGMLAIIVPSLAAITIEIFLGFIILMAGIFQAGMSMRSKMHWWSLASAILSILVGIILLLAPQAGVTVLAAIVVAFLLLKGISEIFLSLKFKLLPQWKWMMASGVITLAIAIMAWANWPILAIWLIGLMVGINLVMFGISLLTIAWNTKPVE